MLAVNVLLYRYGVGYHMVVIKDRQCNSPDIINHVISIVPGGKLVYLINVKFSALIWLLV